MPDAICPLEETLACVYRDSRETTCMPLSDIDDAAVAHDIAGLCLRDIQHDRTDHTVDPGSCR